MSLWSLEKAHAKASIIIVHGFSASKKAPGGLVIAGMLWHAGYHVVLMDVRNYGASSIEDNRTALGVTEYQDVLSVSAWIQNQYPNNRIGLFGASLGASTALIAYGEGPHIEAAFLDTPFSEVRAIIKDELKRNALPPFFALGGILAARFISGDKLLSKSPLMALEKHKGAFIFCL